MNIFYLPDLGEGLAEAEVREWYVKVGDIVAIDQPLISVETAKAVVDVPSPYSGKITKLFGKVGEMIPTHAPLVEFESEVMPNKKDRGTVVGSLEESNNVLDESDSVIGFAGKSTPFTIKVLPMVRSLAKKLHVNLDTVKPTGPQGQITADDVKRAAEQHTSSHEKTEILHGVRHFMALAMTQSHKQVVPVTITEDADITDLSDQYDFTVCMIQAMIAGIQVEPALNTWFDEKTMSLTRHTAVHLGLAVDTEEGLFVPVLRNVEKQDAKQLRMEINTLKKAVHDRSLNPKDFQGSTITLSNFGVFAGRYASLIIVPPQVAILGCGRIREMVGVRNGQMAIRRIVPLSLSFDHRVVTGGEATRFLSAVIKKLEGGVSVRHKNKESNDQTA